MPKTIQQHQADTAFADGRADNVTVVSREKKEWYFTFEVPHPTTGKPDVFAIETQKGELRTWADPRNLMEFLKVRYGVEEAKLTFNDEESNGKSVGKGK